MARPPRALVAVAQVTSTPDKERNFAGCAALVREAAGRGATIVFLPEGFDFIGTDPAQTLSLAESLDGDIMGRYANLARYPLGDRRDAGVTLRDPPGDPVVLSPGSAACGCRSVASTSVARTGPPPSASTTANALLDPTGQLVAAYRKTHLCDVELEGRVSMKESGFTNPGAEIVPPVSTPAGKLGLAICYDLRFPELSLALRRAGADILTYPSAFTFPTGAAHWEVLLRARAIETQCYVVAAAQTGQNHERRVSYGHSLVADPWGTVVAQCSDTPRALLRQHRPRVPAARPPPDPGAPTPAPRPVRHRDAPLDALTPKSTPFQSVSPQNAAAGCARGSPVPLPQGCSPKSVSPPLF
ncbi:Nit1, partial [Columba livia]